jgi:hypothetical protein
MTPAPPKLPNVYIETTKYIIELFDEEQLMEYTIKEGVLFDAPDAKEAKATVIKFRPDTRWYVLGKGFEFFTLTSQARELASTAEFSDNTLSIAFYTPNISLQLLGEMYLKINKPVVPTRIFKNISDARDWLREQMKNHQKSV